MGGSVERRKSITQTPVGVLQGGSTLKRPDILLDSQNDATATPRSSYNSVNCELLDALGELTGDVVIMGGYRGSSLGKAGMSPGAGINA